MLKRACFMIFVCNAYFEVTMLSKCCGSITGLLLKPQHKNLRLSQSKFNLIPPNVNPDQQDIVFDGRRHDRIHFNFFY